MRKKISVIGKGVKIAPDLSRSPMSVKTSMARTSSCSRGGGRPRSDVARSAPAAALVVTGDGLRGSLPGGLRGDALPTRADRRASPSPAGWTRSSSRSCSSATSEHDVIAMSDGDFGPRSARTRACAVSGNCSRRRPTRRVSAAARRSAASRALFQLPQTVGDGRRARQADLRALAPKLGVARRRELLERAVLVLDRGEERLRDRVAIAVVASRTATSLPASAALGSSKPSTPPVRYCSSRPFSFERLVGFLAGRALESLCRRACPAGRREARTR